MRTRAKVAYAVGFTVAFIGEFVGFCGMTMEINNLTGVRFQLWSAIEFCSCILTLVLIFILEIKPVLREIGTIQFRRWMESIDVEG